MRRVIRRVRWGPPVFIIILLRLSTRPTSPPPRPPPYRGYILTGATAGHRALSLRMNLFLFYSRKRRRFVGFLLVSWDNLKISDPATRACPRRDRPQAWARPADSAAIRDVVFLFSPNAYCANRTKNVLRQELGLAHSCTARAAFSFTVSRCAGLCKYWVYNPDGFRRFGYEDGNLRKSTLSGGIIE